MNLGGCLLTGDPLIFQLFIKKGSKNDVSNYRPIALPVLAVKFSNPY